MVTMQWWLCSGDYAVVAMQWCSGDYAVVAMQW